MKYLASILILAFLNAGSFTIGKSQQTNNFTLTGKIEGLEDKSKIYLILNKDTVAITESQGQTFQFIGHVTGEANYYFLKLDTQVAKKSSEALWLINGQMNLKGNLLDWPNLVLTGSDAHDEYKEAMKLYRSTKKAEDKYIDYKNFIGKYRNSLYVPNLLDRILPILSPKEADSLYSILSARAKSSFYGKLLTTNLKKITVEKFGQNTNSDSTIIQDFRFTLENGTEQNLLTAIKSNKYTLIDFWASWCAPCRSAIPQLKKVYKDFHKRGFNIIGISIDKSNRKWKEALAADSATWLQGLDNIQEAHKYVFELAAIPAYFLVDNTGKIISSTHISKANKIHSTGKALVVDKNLYETISNLMKKKN